MGSLSMVIQGAVVGQRAPASSHSLQLRVLYMQNDHMKKVFLDVTYARITEPLTYKGYGSARGSVETDPSLWKSFIMSEVILDCCNNVIKCAFVDGESASHPMTKGCIARMHDIIASLPTETLARVRSDVLDVYVRYVLPGLELPSSYGLWMAESALLKQEKRIRGIDEELDRQAQMAQNIKLRMRQMRVRFAKMLHTDASGFLRRCGPIYLEMVWEGIESDIVEYNKSLSLLQAHVDRLKEQLAAEATAQNGHQTKLQDLQLLSPPILPFQSIESTTSNQLPRVPASLVTSPNNSEPTSPLTETPNLSLTPTMSIQDQLNHKRQERDTAWELVTIHIEAREKCKAELRARKADDDRAVAALVATQDGEHEYISLHRQLREVRAQRNFLSQDKLMAVNAREVSKAEIRQIKENQIALQKRTQIEVAKKRKMKRQSWQSGRFVE